jgi:hypothetical protein
MKMLFSYLTSIKVHVNTETRRKGGDFFLDKGHFTKGGDTIRITGNHSSNQIKNRLFH